MSRMASARWARASTIWYSSIMKSLRRQGNGAGGRCKFEIAQAALEVGLVGKHGERGSPAGTVARGEPGRVEVGANEPFGGRSFLDFGDDGQRGLSLTAQGAGPAARAMRGGAALQFGGRDMRFGRFHRGPCRRQNDVELRCHVLGRVYGDSGCGFSSGLRLDPIDGTYNWGGPKTKRERTRC